MAYSIKDISQNPNILQFSITLSDGQNAVLRPLESKDVNILTQFLTNLSTSTREFYKLDSFDQKTAQQMCDDIAKYDKIRFIADFKEEVIGLFEFSMDIPKNDLERFKDYGIELHHGEDCRFGPCVADKFQGTGLASMIFPNIKEIAKKLGQQRIILWGGVFSDNYNAIKFYMRNDFKEIGKYKNDEGKECIDMILNLLS